jgi:hypothetical protein
VAINEKDIINLVLKNYQLFESSEIDMLVQQKRLQSKEADYYGWKFDLSGKYGIEKDQTKKDTNYTYTRQQSQKDREIGLKASKLFENGIALSIDFDRKLPIDKQQKYKNFIYDKTLAVSEINRVITTRISIPLLKGADGGENKKLFEIAKIDKKIEALKLLEDKEDEATETLMHFINLANNMDLLNIYQKYLSTLLHLNNQDKNPTLAYKIKKVTLAKNKINSYLNKALLGLRKTVKLSKNHLKMVDFDEHIRAVLVKDIRQNLQKYNRDLKLSKLEIVKKKLYLKRYENSELPDLTLSFTNTRLRDEGNYSSYSYKANNENVVSLDFIYPLGGSPSNEYNLLKTRLDKRKKEIDYQIDLKNKVLDIKILAGELTASNKALNSYQNQLKLQENFAESQRYLAGKGNIRFALDEIDEYYQVHLDYLEEWRQYHQNRIKYDNLLVRLLLSNRCYYCEKYDK